MIARILAYFTTPDEPADVVIAQAPVRRRSAGPRVSCARVACLSCERAYPLEERFCPGCGASVDLALPLWRAPKRTVQ